MTIQHPQETILETLQYTGISVALVKWREAVWCGKIGYAVNNTDEPDVEAVLNGYMALPFGEIKDKEENWEICFSVNYLAADRPNGVMFGFLVSTEEQPDGCDILKTPAALYMRIELSEETARALGQEPWSGGIPPHEWIGEQIAPAFGYRYGSDTLPIVEYYGHYDPVRNTHTYRYLYVPVEKNI